MTTINRKPEGVSFSQEDWDEVSDTPEATDAELAEMRPLKEGAPEIYKLITKRGRGRPPVEAPKVNLTLRVDPAVLDAYKATGAGWQTRMHEALARGAGELAR
ncbi:BrnA antitoxin family protein [Methylobacterium sp. W2]|uniref:BrnA antitoxin family protein n=1 Tax=Methylobacterium sp. W2 TaxID=2598107 RepID=UPI001D0C8529|nr:BrnA antitoxin family protein [Methylobacterium sp. W2]MCC0804911.1 BrnA antitoxin family protein [Methylobacterium sp. W2]